MSQSRLDSSFFSQHLRNNLKGYEDEDAHRVYRDAPDDFFVELAGLSYKNKDDHNVKPKKLDRYYETIYSGCSETFGDHLIGDSPSLDQELDLANSNKYIWGTIVSEHVGQSYANLAVGGASAISILEDYRHHIKKYGAPKNLFILYPRIDCRLPFFEDPKHLINLKEDGEGYSNFEIFNAINIGIYDNEVKMSKRPHFIQEILSRPYVTYLNIQAILQMETLCQLSGTRFIYSTWSIETSSIIEAANSAAVDLDLDLPFSGYIKTDYGIISTDYPSGEDSLPQGCHEDLKDHPNYYMGRDNSHMGVHAHRHVAENFIAKLDKQ